MNKFKHVAMASAVACLGSLPASAEDMVYSNFLVADNPINGIVAEVIEDVASATASEPSMEVVPGGILAGPPAVLASLQSGAIDAGFMVFPYYPSELPALTLISNLYGRDHRISAPAVLETMLLGCPACVAEMEEQGIQVVFPSAGPSQVMLCSKVAAQTPGDLKGLKIRATGPMAGLAAALGGTPTNIDYAEIYTALQRGVIDCLASDPTDLRDIALWEVVKHVTTAALGTYNGIAPLVFSRDVWNGFPAETKRAWYDASAKGMANLTNIVAKNGSSALEEGAEKGLFEILEPSQEMADVIAAYRASEAVTLVEQATQRGVAGAQEVADYYTAAYQRWSDVIDEINGGEPYMTEEQVAEYARHINETIYAKVSTD